MLGVKELFVVLLLTATLNINFGDANLIAINSPEWTNYKTSYGKNYTASTISEALALYYYNYNQILITNYNIQAELGLRTYRLAANQFTDMRFIQFNALFPKTTQPATSAAATPPAVQAAPPTFDPIADLGLRVQVKDQGTACNSGWAYATANSIEIFTANRQGQNVTTPLSAQNLIDCAGSGTGCTRQVSQTAFDYLVKYKIPLYNNTQYPENNKQATQGMCVPSIGSTATATNLASYARIADADDATMMKYVAAGYPVVIEYDPTSFEFMCYKSGIFQQPIITYGGSHYMTVVGYGRDAVSNLDYWLVLNSFGRNWGENGYIRIRRNVPLAKSALFPIALG